MLAQTSTRKQILAETFRRYPTASRGKVRQFSKIRRLTDDVKRRLRQEVSFGMDDATATACIYIVHRNSRLLG